MLIISPCCPSETRNCVFKPWLDGCFISFFHFQFDIHVFSFPSNIYVVFIIWLSITFMFLFHSNFDIRILHSSGRGEVEAVSEICHIKGGIKLFQLNLMWFQCHSFQYHHYWAGLMEVVFWAMQLTCTYVVSLNIYFYMISGGISWFILTKEYPVCLLGV